MECALMGSSDLSMPAALRYQYPILVHDIVALLLPTLVDQYHCDSIFYQYWHH
jgi:hypothetical protein